MKTKAILFFLSALLFAALHGCSFGYMANNGSTGNEIQNNVNQDYNANQDYNVDDLNQYGDWVDVNPYGRVWQPSVNPGWQPFTNGLGIMMVTIGFGFPTNHSAGWSIIMAVGKHTRLWLGLDT